MLQYLRQNTGSWIIKIILGVIVLVFIFLGMGSIGSKKRGTVATVDDEPISMEAYQQSYNNLIQEMRNRFGDNFNQDLIEMFNVKRQALDMVIEERLLAQEAERLGVIVTEEEIRNSLLSIPAFQKNGAFDMEQYKRVLSANRMTPESFEESQIARIKQQKVRDLVLSSVTVSDMEAEKWYKYRNTEAGIHYVAFDPSQYRSLVTPDEETLRAYYEENRENYKTDVMLKAEYLEFSPADYADRVALTQAELKQYYDKNIKEFTSPEKVEASHILIRAGEQAGAEKIEKAREKAMMVYQMAVEGKDFSELAEEYSEGPTSDSGGFLGSFGKDEMVAPFSEAAFSMAPGDISKPVKTRMGFHIIKVHDKFEAATQSFETSKEAIREKLIDRRIKDLAYYGAGEAFDAIIDGDSLEQAGLAAGEKLQTAGPFSRSGEELTLSGADKYARAAFETPMGEISDVKKIGTAYYIIKPVQKIEPEIRSFAEVKEAVRSDFVAEKSIEKAENHARDILDQVTAAGELKKVAQSNDLSLDTTEKFTRDSRIPGLGQAPSVMKAAFELTPEERICPEVLNAGGVYYIIALDEKEMPQGFESSEEKEKIKQSLLERKRQDVYADWIDRLRQEKSVEITQAGLFD